MNKILALLLTAVLLLSAAQAKPDFNKILGKLSEAGAQVAQQADAAEFSPFAAVQAQLDDIKESYKAEGRAYAKELGDIMMERAMANKKVDKAVDSVRALCWGVVIYITAVSFLLFGMMLRLNALLGKLKQNAGQKGE